MASDFTSAYLAKREKEKKQAASGSSSGSANVQSADSKRAQTSFSDAYLAKRYNDGALADRQAQSAVDDIGYDPDTGEWYSIGWRDELARRKYNPSQLQSVFESAQGLQKSADALNPGADPHLQRPSPDYGLIDNYNQSTNGLSLAARSRALAQKALADYEKQYRSQLDSYGPYVDGSGKDVAGQYNARKKAVEQADQAYEDALALYQKDQWLSEKARKDVETLKQINEYTAAKDKYDQANEQALSAWSDYYSMLYRAQDFDSQQQNPYTRDNEALIALSKYNFTDPETLKNPLKVPIQAIDKAVNPGSTEQQIIDEVLSDDELALLTYLRNTQGEEAVQEYLQRSAAYGRLQDQHKASTMKFAQKHPVSASLMSTMYNTIGEVTAPVGMLKDKLTGKELSDEAEYFAFQQDRDLLRAGVMQDMGPTGQFVYQTLMSAVLDSGVNGLIGAATGGSTWVGAGLTGASGFSDMVRQVKARGADDTQALVLGLIEGAAEVVTEKMGFDRLADLLTSKAPFKSALKSVLANMMSEFGEESITTVINQTADYLYGEISGRETEFTGRIEDYMAEGKTEGEALANALLDMGGETLMDGLGGALGGAVMGGGSVAINKGISAAVAKYADYKFNKQQSASQTAQETTQAQQTAQTTENQAEAENRAQTAQEAETRARIERLAQETADAEMGEQSARQEIRQTEQQRVRQTTRQAAQTTENASAESVHNAAAVYGRDAASFESHYEGGTLQNYRRAFDAVYQAGKVNLSLEQVNQAGGEIVSGLSEQAKAEIWQAGRNAAASVVVPGVSKQYVGKMNHNQRTQVRILDAIGKKYGIQFDVVSSLDYGKTAGNAALVGRNHIVVASDAMNSAYVQAGVHELVHNLRRESSAYYDAFSSVVMDVLKKDGSFDLQAAVAERIRQYAEQGQQLSREDALEEIVAEAAPAALTNREAMRAFVKENRSLAEKVRDFFVRFADELREIAAKYGVGNSREEVNAMLRADAQDLVNIAEVLDMALSAAQESATVERATTGIELQGLEKYSLKDRNVIEGYLDAVDQEVLEAAQTYRADKNAKFRRIKLGDVQQREAEAIKSLTGKDVSGYTHNIDRNGFVHIENRHGINGAQDQSMSDLNDVARQGWVIENYDDIGRLQGRDGKYVDSYGYLGTNGEPSPVVVYRKRINGTYYLVEAVADGRWKKLWTVSAYISDKKIDASWTSNASFETPNFTSETGSTAASADIVAESGDIVNPSAEISLEARELSDADTKFSLREKEPPEKTLTAYKVFVAFENKPGQLFPPMVANPNGESTPVGVWLDADEGVTAKDKNGNELVNTLGRKQVKAGGKGTQGGSGALAYRPGWHLGELPMAKQFSRVNPETGVKELFPANFIWAECEIAADRNYQEEAMSYGYNKNGKFQHSLAGLPKLPTDGYYMYRTNPDPTTLPWYITGAMKVTKILSDAETDQILRDHGIEPMKRQGGPIDLEKFGFKAGEVGENGTKFSLKDSEAFKKWFGDSKVVDKKGNPLVVYHATNSEFNVFDRSKLGGFTSGNTDWQPAVRSAQIGFWFSDRDLAATIFTDPDQTKAVYLSMQKPYRTKLESLWNALEHTRPETYVKRLQERGYDGLRVQDSEFGGVSYVAFEPTQIKSATNNSGAFDAANPDIRFSLKDTSEVDEQAKALLDGVDVELNAEVVQAYARSALRAADKDAAKINQQVRQAAGKILKDTASKYDRRTLESNMRAIVERFAQDGGEGVSQAAVDMAKAIIEQNTHLDTTLRDQYSALRSDLRENGVSLTESQKAEAASIYGSYNEFRKALMGTVKLTDKSMTLEARWDELSTMYPEIFKADTVEGDQVNALMAFKQMMQPVYVNDFGMDMDTAAVDLGLRIQGDALSIAGAKEASKQLYGSAQKIESRVKKAYDAELKAQKKVKVAQFQEIAERLAEAKKLGDTQGYDNAMADYRKLIRKETGVKMPGGENMSPSAKMRFSQLAEAMQEARIADDTAAYQEAFKAYKELLKKERIQSTVVAPAVQDALNQARARFKASQEAKEGTVKKQKATKRVIKQAKDLIDMLANKKKGVRVPRMMQNNLLTLLEGLDINGRGASNKGELTQQAAAMREQLTALRQTYQEIWDSQSKGEAPDVLNGLMMVMSEEQRAQLDDALSILEQGGRFTLRSMTTEQLKALGDALTTVKQTVSTIGVLWRKGRYNNVAELADASIQEMGKRPEAKLKGMSAAGTTRDFLMLDMLEPVSYGERLGQAGSEIIQGLYEGERAKFGRLREAQEATAQMMEDSGVTGYDIGEWRKHVNTVRMGGHDVKLTDTQAMDIYLTAQRPQGKQHMLGDGIRLKTSKQTGAQVFTVHMTEEDIAKVSDLLSDKQKRLAHKMQRYLAGDVAKWGNDVTQQMYLYDYFTEQTYWPLTSDPNVLKTSEPSADRSLTAITQPGFMKPLTKNANNPVIIMDAVDVFNRHVAEMASYSGLAMPMTDALGYMNYKQRNEEGALTGSVKESMERLLGGGGGKYMVTLLQDLNHARYGDDLTHLSKLTGNYKRSAVSGKIRVVIQQPTAIARAAQEISPVYLAQGLKLGNKADIAEMQKYSALAWWKGNASGMDIGVGRSADQILWGDTSKLDTARTKVETAGGLIDAGKADDVTWAAMWRAVKRETQRIHPELQVGSEAYFKAVAERFDGIMDKTQVVDSIMHRSQIMRSQNGLIKELTAFQAEPIKSYNMLARSAMELGRNPRSKAAQTAATRSVLVFAANAALTALAEAAFDVFKHRDDDDTLIEYLLNAKKGFLKEYTDEFMGSWLDNLNVIAMIPGISQAYEILTGGSAPEMMSFEGMSDAVQAAKTFVDHYFKGNTRKTTAYGAVAPVLKAASQITGLPIAGIMANTEMLAKVADPQWLNYKAVSGKFADNYEALYAAILEGDKRAITRIRGRLAADSQGASAKSPKQIDQGVANVLAEKDERIAQAYQLRKEGKASQLVALQKQIMADGFTEAMVTAAINRYENQAKTQEETTKDKDMNAQLTAKLFSYENLFAAMRTGSIEDVGIIAEYLEANSTAKDPAATIRSQVSGEFKQEYLDAVMNGGSTDGLKKKLMSLGLTEDDLNGWVKSARYAELKESVGEGDVADAKQEAKELIDSGADVSDVVSSLNNKYKSVYIELVNSGRTAEAEKLQKDLESLGLIKKKTGQNYYRKDYMDKWVTDYNKKNK